MRPRRPAPNRSNRSNRIVDRDRCMSANEDALMSFLDEPSEPSIVESRGAYWRILIVDDDADVHRATEYALTDVNILGRPLKFLHAYSSLEAFDVLSEDSDIAVILLDVVMEKEDAGLIAVGVIRRDMGLTHPRIILRTGQPGYAPELSTIQSYDINDYRTKSELTRIKLYTALTAAIRSYDQLRRLETSRRGLEKIIQASNRFMAEPGLREFAAGVINQIASLIDVKPEGLVCARAADCANAYTVIAAAGRLEHLVNCRVDEVEDEHIRKSLEHCLAVRRTLIEENGMTLFFPGRRHDLAAYIESRIPVHEVDRQMIEVFCGNIAVCGENIKLVEELRHVAFTDPLVDLPNRSFFTNALDQRLAFGERNGLTVALLDVDQFAEANDMFGYRYGDQLLKMIARRLRESLDDDCVVARIANDTFGVLGPATAVRPDTLQKIFSDPFDIDGVDHPVSISIGFVRADANSGTGADLLKDASIAIKRAKSSGQGQYAHYTTEVGIETRTRTGLLHDLRHAFKQEALTVYYQPQIDLAADRLVGVEALVRWPTENGFIPPDRFIPIAEQSGLIVALGAWVLNTSLKAVMQLRQAGAKELRVAVNVSPTQFRQPNFIAIVDQALAETGAPADALELEITESVAIMGQEYVKQSLTELRSRNIAIAIDDFGTGYSSLSYLGSLPADRLKIDRAFVSVLGSNKPGARIAELVIPLGKQLNMKVLAEGIETKEQLDILRSMGCDEGQGWYFAKALPLDELIVWLQRRGAN